MKRALAIWTLTAATALAQSTVTGSKTMQGSWDASGASATKPAKSGAALPSTCGVGEFFFNTAAAAGQNVYLCDPANSWTQMSSGVNSVFGRVGIVAAQSGDYSFSQLSGTLSSGQLPAAGGDLSGTLPSATVKAIQGQSIATMAPSTGQVLTWGGSSWGPQTPSSSGSGGSVTERVLVFDGSTVISSETMTSWSCGSGSASSCSTAWTVPAGVYHVHVQVWSAGGSGQGEGAGNSGTGGGGGGFWEGQCAVTPSANLTVAVGSGGVGVATSPWSGDGGSSVFGTCATVVGGSGGANSATAGWGGYLLGSGRWGWLDLAPAFTNLHDATKAFCTYGNTAGATTTRGDGGGCGGGQATSAGNGFAGGGSINGGGGGGSGSYNGSTGGAGGVSALGNTLYTSGGNGGNGGVWTTAGGYVACTNGTAPGGGGGSYGSATSGSTIYAGCNGARGEIRVYYVR